MAEAKAPARRLTAEELIAQINKKEGFGTIIRGSELLHQELPRVTSGSLALDYALGGGFPLNQWNEIIGEEHHGKTVMAMQTIAANMALDPEYYVLWIASEQFVAPWARINGMDLNRVFIYDNNVMEECYETVLKWLDNQACDAIVIDSLANLSPGEEAEKAMEDFQVGLGARLTAKFSRKSTVASRRSLVEQERDCLILIINQFRMKIGVKYGDPRTTPQGKAKDFAFFTRVEVRRDEWLKLGGDASPKVGLSMKARVIKNKTAPSQRVASMHFYFEDDVPGHPVGRYDIGKDIADTAIALDVVTLRGNTYVFGDRKFVGRAALYAAVLEELDLRDEIREAVLAHSHVAAPVEPVEELEEPTPAKPARATKKASAPAQAAPARRIKRAT